MKKNITVIGLCALLCVGCVEKEPRNNVAQGEQIPQEIEKPDNEEELKHYEGRNNEAIFVFGQNEGPEVKEIRDDGVIVYAGNKYANKIQVGSIICSAPVENAPNGYFYKVKEIRTNDDNTYIITEFASLEDAVQDGRADNVYSLIDYVSTIEGENGEVLPLSKADVSSAITIPVSITKKISGVDVTLSGLLKLSGNIHLDISFSDWNLKLFEFWIEPELAVKVSLDSKLDLKGDLFKKKISTIHLEPITFNLGYIPVVIKSDMEIWLKATANGKVIINCELVNIDYKYRLGAHYHEGYGWGVINESTSSKATGMNGIQAFEVNGGLSLSVPEIQIIPYFYGIRSDNYKLGLKATYYIKMAISDTNPTDISEGYFNPKLNVTAGLDEELEASLKILFRSLLDFKPKITILETTFVNKHLYPHFSDMKIQNNNSGQVTLSFMMDNLDDCFFEEYSDYGIYVKKGQWAVNEKDGSEFKKSLGPIDLKKILQSNVNHNHIFEVQLSGLEPNSEYSVRPYTIDSSTNHEHRGNVYTFETESTLCIDEQHPHFVDLGLSVNWACCNLGATKPEEYGDYYAWGETRPKTDYDWPTYKWCKGTKNTLTKYNTNSSFGYVDNKMILDPVDDAAAVNWDGNWRMPTMEEMTELLRACSFTMTVKNGVDGFLVTSKKTGYSDKSIFLPAAGYRRGKEIYTAGIYGNYYMSTLYVVPYGAYVMRVSFNSKIMSAAERAWGLPIRPVCPKD